MKRQKTNPFRPGHEARQHEGNPLTLRETKVVRAHWIPAHEFEVEPPQAVRHHIPRQRRALGITAQNEADACHDDGQYPHRFYGLDRKEPHAHIVRSKASFGMFPSVANTPMMVPTM